MSHVRVFVSFDLDHDAELYDMILAQSGTAGFDFAVLGGSERSGGGDVGGERARSRIREADQMLVLCGEHTEASIRMADELRIAKEEETPYILLWGRRELMCTKPIGAKPAEGMFSWTKEILQDQIGLTLRNERTDAQAKSARADAQARKGLTP